MSKKQPEKKNSWFSKLSKISALHYFKLLFRSALFLWAVVVYILMRLRGDSFRLYETGIYTGVSIVVWVVFAVEMVLRFFPSTWESMGCQKQFRRNYEPRPADYSPKEPDTHPGGRWMVLASWIALNGAIGALHHCGVIDDGILVLICLAYSVCDVICILFFCPFQTWMMKNRCCVSCPIYNWDYAMMFTPLLFIRDGYTWSLLALALGLLVRWELTYYLHPERYKPSQNACLDCNRCEEKLCRHKRQLQRFMKKRLEWFEKLGLMEKFR